MNHVHILIVEDSPTQALQLQLILEQQAYQVSLATNGKEALTLLRQHKPTLVISDIVMPEMDGYELCRQIRADRHLEDLPVILLTSVSNPKDVIQGLSCGADNFITKPYDEHHLFYRIQNILTNRELRKGGKAEMGISVLFAGEYHFITADRMQILDMLLSTYETAVQRNGDLVKAQTELKALNEQLEERVAERTAALTAEIEGRKHIEAQLAHAQRMESIGRLAGGIAHDFNNLLTVINSCSGLLLSDLEKGDARRADVEEIKKAADRATALTRQLSAFSRRQVLEPRILNLNEVLLNLDQMLRRLISENIALVTLSTSDIGLVKVDPGQIEQTVMNLVVNARDAMPQGGCLTIETADVELDADYAKMHIEVAPGRYVMLAVSDTGVGMSPEVQARIFEPFFTTKELGKGTGLGLSMVYGIVKQSGGHIWVYSEEGHGTTFKIYLPRVQGMQDTLAPSGESGRSYGGTETILLVEDDQAIRRLAARMLAKLGYKVLEAPSGTVALQVCGEASDVIHLLLTDVILPGLSGKDLADRVQTLRPGIKVLYMSGYTDDIILRNGVLDVDVPFLSKPFTPETITSKVRAVLDSRN